MRSLIVGAVLLISVPAQAQEPPDAESLIEGLNDAIRAGEQPQQLPGDQGDDAPVVPLPSEPAGPSVALPADSAPSKQLLPVELPNWAIVVRDQRGEVVDLFGQINYAVTASGEVEVPGYDSPPGTRLGHRLISSHPDSYGCEFNESKVVGVMLFVAGCDGSEVFDLAEKAFDQVAQAIEQRAECGDVNASGHRLDVGPGAALGQRVAQSIAVIGPVGQEDLARPDGVQHVAGTSAVMCLTRRQLEHQRQAIGVDQGMDLGCQPAPRAPHASGVTRVPSGGIGLFETPFLTLAAC